MNVAERNNIFKWLIQLYNCVLQMIRNQFDQDLRLNLLPELVIQHAQDNTVSNLIPNLSIIVFN